MQPSPRRSPIIEKISGFRNALIHGYDVIDNEITWDIVQEKLPVLRKELEELMQTRAAAMADSYRTEKDSMGEMQVPAAAYYGAQTARAVENFPISGLRFSRRFIAAMGL